MSKITVRQITVRFETEKELKAFREKSKGEGRSMTKQALLLIRDYLRENP